MSTLNSNLSNLILDSLRDYLTEKRLPVPVNLGPNSVFLQGDLPMDSLDLAVFLLVLEEKTGHDPFRNGFRSFVSVADLTAIYASHST